MIRERRWGPLAQGALILILMLLSRSAGVAQVAPADSLRPDTLVSALPDTVRRVDSVDPVRPFFPTAAPFSSIVPALSLDAARIVSELQLARTRYFTAFDVLRRAVPAHPLAQGQPGLVRALSYAGAPPSAIAVSFGGRPLEALAAYGYDLELYPMEYLERAEIVTGPRAMLYGTGEALMAVNLVQPRFDVEASYVRAWYAQDAGDVTGGQLMYARNVGRRANLSLGFRRLATGNETTDRFDNQRISNWAVHGNATWRPLPSLMISLTELFADATRGQNGGLTPESPFDPLSPGHEVVNGILEERTVRHDVTLAAEWILGSRRTTGLDTLLAAGASSTRLDSAIRLDIAAYGSWGRRTLEVGDSIVTLEGGPLESERTTAGVRASIWVPTTYARIEAMALAELRGRRDRDDATTSFDLGRRQAGIIVEVPLGGALAVRGGGRFSSGWEGEIGGAAAELVIAPSDRLSARLSARVQRHACPCEDPMRMASLIDGVRFSDYRTSLMGEAELTWRDSATFVSLMAFARRAEPLDAASGLSAEMIPGGEARLRLPFWLLALEAHAHAILLPDNDRRMPVARVLGDLHAPLLLIDGNLELRVGTTLEYQAPFAGARYDEATGSFWWAPSESATTFRQYPLWDAYAQARIGTAFLRLALRNILDVEAWSVYRHPERGRSLIFEVTWSFID